jgi:protein TonB
MLPGRLKPAPDTQGTVELLMVEKKGSGEPTPASRPIPPQPSPAQSAAKPPPPQPPRLEPQPETQPQAPPVPRVEKADAIPAGRPTTPDDAGEPVPAPAPPRQQDAAATAPPADTKADDTKADDAKPREAKQETPQRADTTSPPAKQQPALTFNLDGTDSLTSAEVIGQHVIPASLDDRFRNRPPVFPRESELRGERGAVIVVIHVSEAGQAVGAEVANSSGHALLDKAAVDAVLKWHFRPALKDGKAVPFDMPMRFIFEGQ